MSTSESKFKVGDIVEAFGCRGVVTVMGCTEMEVAFENGQNFMFWLDGKYFEWAKESQLKLIERPKKKVSRTGYVNVYSKQQPFVVHDRVYNTLDEANMWKFGRIDCVPVTYTFEVEEDCE